MICDFPLPLGGGDNVRIFGLRKDNMSAFEKGKEKREGHCTLLPVSDAHLALKLNKQGYEWGGHDRMVVSAETASYDDVQRKS